MFYAGVIEKSTGNRFILRGDAKPVVANLEVLSDQGRPANFYDWGQEADMDACRRTAFTVLLSAVGKERASKYFEMYADEVVRVTMMTGRVWLLDHREIEDWVLVKAVL